MRRMLLTCALLVGGSPNVYSQPASHPRSAGHTGAYVDADPNDQIATYKYLREEILENVRTIYFAVGCGVLSEEDAEPLISEGAAYLEQEAFSVHFLDVQGADLRDDAEHEGLARASVAGACDYWRQHPKAVVAMLRAAKAATTRLR